jgi:hypothetical protein
MCKFHGLRARGEVREHADGEWRKIVVTIEKIILSGTRVVHAKSKLLQKVGFAIEAQRFSPLPMMRDSEGTWLVRSM